MSDVHIQTSVSSLQVPEGGEAKFNVRLSRRPERSVTVRVTRTEGDSNISVASGASLYFTRSDYSQWKTVTLAAAQDGDGSNGQATFGLTGEDLESAQVTAMEVDDDTVGGVAIQTSAGNLQIPEGGRATFNVRLAARPARSVTVRVERIYGDTDITVVSRRFPLFQHHILQPVEDGHPGCRRGPGQQ